MKKFIAIALLGTLSHLAPVQAQEATSFKAWTSKHGTTQNAVEQHKTTKHRPSQHRPSTEHYTRPASLRQAGQRLERLEHRQARLEQDLRRAQRYHASRSEIRSLRQRLRRVNERMRVAKRDYKHFLKLKIGTQSYRLLLKHTAWLSDHQYPKQARQVGLHRPYSWRD